MADKAGAMPAQPPNPKADFCFAKQGPWQEGLIALRKVCLAAGLSEGVKWGQACYTDEGRNVALIHAFKSYFALLFFKGVLLKDEGHVLVQQTANVQSARQMRFASASQVAAQHNIIATYLAEAIAVERAGLQAPKKTTPDYPVVDELKAAFAQDPELARAFAALTPGRQRGYLLHFASAQQSTTRQSRIGKARPAILKGLGLQD